MHLYGKNIEKSISQNVLKINKTYTLFNDDLMLIFDRFTAMPILRPYAFVWEKY